MPVPVCALVQTPGFNPRPPLLAGEWQDALDAATATLVSIHARHCWRANESTSPTSAASPKFQSTPAIAGGRMKPSPRSCASRMLFQSTPAIAGGRMAKRPRSTSKPRAFQSTPAIAGGRMGPQRRPGRQPRCFNPRPPLLAGEWWAGGWLARVGTRGFNPRPPLLAGEWRKRAKRTGGRRFQSTPAIAGGRMEHLGRCGRAVIVSIHARHCWRANAHKFGCFSLATPFQSTPAIAGGRMQKVAPQEPHTDTFQSTPAIAGGRMGAPRRRTSADNWFQSTPAIAGGRMALDARGGLQPAVVSIHARHCWRANASWRLGLLMLMGFNPRPPLLAGEWRR